MIKQADFIQVQPLSITATTGTLRIGGLAAQCAIGRSGVALNKHEGDGATPLGTWRLRNLLYRADRLARPETALPVEMINHDDGWCDEPAHEHYNLPVKQPFSASHEHLWRDDHLYDLVVPLGYNDAPPVPEQGSAIFFHLAGKDYAPTEGCVAVSLADMTRILTLCGPQTAMEILPPPPEDS